MNRYGLSVFALMFGSPSDDSVSFLQTVQLLEMRRRAIIAFCTTFRNVPPSAFGVPEHPRDLTFLFLPSDVQYTGPNGAFDDNFDPR